MDLLLLEGYLAFTGPLLWEKEEQRADITLTLI